MSTVLHGTDTVERELQSPYDRHIKHPEPKLAYNDPSTLPKVVDPSENYADDNKEDPSDEDPVIDNNDGNENTELPKLAPTAAPTAAPVSSPTSSPTDVPVVEDGDADQGDSKDGGRGGSNDGRGGSNDYVAVDCQFTAGGLFVGIGDNVDEQARISTVLTYDYEIDTDPPRTTVLGMGDESTALAMDLILDQVIVPQIEGEVTDCVFAQLFEQCDNGSGASRRLSASNDARVLSPEQRRKLALVGISKSEDDQLVYFGSCQPADSSHLCDIVNGEMTLFHDDAATVEEEKDAALLAIKKCLESDELLEDIQGLHPEVMDIRFKPSGSDISGLGRTDTPIGTSVDSRSLNSTPIIAIAATTVIVVAFLLAYRRLSGSGGKEEEEDSDDDSNAVDIEMDAADIANDVPGGAGLSKPPALDFDAISEKDVKDSSFTPNSVNDQSTSMTFDSSDISGSRTPNVSSFQPHDNNLLDIPENDSELDLLPSGSMDFGSRVMT